MRRNGKSYIAEVNEIAGSRRRELVVRLHVLVKKVGIEFHLVAEDFVLGVHKTTIALRVRKRACVSIIVKVCNTTWRVAVGRGRRPAVSKEGRAPEKGVAETSGRISTRRDHRAARELKVKRTGIRT